jgi:hypothetical protein
MAGLEIYCMGSRQVVCRISDTYEVPPIGVTVQMCGLALNILTVSSYTLIGVVLKCKKCESHTFIS